MNFHFPVILKYKVTFVYRMFSGNYGISNFLKFLMLKSFDEFFKWIFFRLASPFLIKFAHKVIFVSNARISSWGCRKDERQSACCLGEKEQKDAVVRKMTRRQFKINIFCSVRHYVLCHTTHFWMIRWVIVY